MKPFLNIFTVGLFIMAGAVGILEARQASHFHERIQSLKQQQIALSAHISLLEQERDEANDRLASMQAKNEASESDTNMLELLYLRGEVSRLEANETATKNDPIAIVARDAWLARVNQLKQYVEKHPDEAIPEFQYLSAREWLVVMESSDDTNLAQAVGQLKFQAESKFALAVLNALMKYTRANNEQFPDDFSQLQPYADATMEQILAERYEIQPASVVNQKDNQSNIQLINAMGSHVITSRFTLENGSSARFAIYPTGYILF
jgi:hypothetical protein